VRSTSTFTCSGGRARTCNNRLQRLGLVVQRVAKSPLSWVFSDPGSVQCCLVWVRKLEIRTWVSTQGFAMIIDAPGNRESAA
jgi:hypothetical protein